MKRSLVLAMAPSLAFAIIALSENVPAQTPPCSNKWFEVRPGSMIPGPLLKPGSHKIWVGRKDPQKGTVGNWNSFGPYQVDLGTKYLLILRGHGAISGLIPNDPAIARYSSPGKNVASIYYKSEAVDGLWYAVCTQLTTASPPVATATPSPSNHDVVEKEIFDNGNLDGVANGPTRQTQFTIVKAHLITTITTYHWNNGKGTNKAGTISLRGTDGRIYGPWTTTGRSGSGGARIAYWDCHPNIKLPAGTYVVIDSDTRTWAQNPGSKGQGFTVVLGRDVK